MINNVDAQTKIKFYNILWNVMYRRVEMNKKLQESMKSWKS